MIGNRILIGVIENVTLAALSCDQESHTDGGSTFSSYIRKQNETLGSSPCDLKPHTDGESENETLGSSPCDQKSHTDGASEKETLCYKLETQTADSKLTGNEWHLIAHGIRNALTIHILNDSSNSQL